MKLDSTAKMSSVLDTVAVGLSGLCLVHCLALPLLIALFPLFGASLIEHETFHQLILVAVIPTTAVSLGAGYRRHRHRPVAYLGVAGVAALVFAAFALHALHAHHSETWITVAGGLMIASAHVGNFRRCRHAGHATGHCCGGSESHE